MYLKVEDFPRIQINNITWYQESWEGKDLFHSARLGVIN